jgi:hypothetical protein
VGGQIIQGHLRESVKMELRIFSRELVRNIPEKY